MTPTAAAARASQTSAPSLRDRLKDPSLLREQCYIDGGWVGAPARPVTNPVNGAELAKVPVMSTAETTAWSVPSVLLKNRLTLILPPLLAATVSAKRFMPAAAG